MQNTHARPAFSFVLPTKIIFGNGCVKGLRDELTVLGASRPLIVTDATLAAAGVLDRAVSSLGGVEYKVFDGAEANPKDVNVAAGAAEYAAFGADSIIAVGGGSPIDCAKAIGVLAANGASDIKAFEGKDARSKPLPPLICVPTTAGTGSEITFSAVITDTRNRYKMTVKNAFTAPRTALCDPELTQSVPASVTAATGMDALTHAIEAYSATCSEPIGDAAALHAIELICGSIREAYANGMNLTARYDMLMGSLLAGIAFSHSDVASVHCISETLGGMYDLAHGVCNSVFLPYVMEYNMKYCVGRYARIARAMGIAAAGSAKAAEFAESADAAAEGAEELAAAAVEAVRQMAADVGLPTFASFGVPRADFGEIARVSAKNISTGSNPRPMAEQDYLAVLEMALK